VVRKGKQVELLPNGKLAPDSRFTGAPGGSLIAVDRSFNNHDPKLPPRIDFLPDDERVPEPTPGPGPGPGTAPDLVISATTSESLTVTNQGNANAGFFVVRVVEPASGAQETVRFTSLAAGASSTRTLGCVAHDRSATADASGQVTESNESNNGATVPSCKP